MLLVSTENEFDSNGSSLDADIKDKSSQSQDNHEHLAPSSATPVHSLSLTNPQTINSDIKNASFIKHDDYLSHIHLPHSNSMVDPNLNHHKASLDNNTIDNDYILRAGTSKNSLPFLKPPKAIKLSSSLLSSDVVNYDLSDSINFLDGLVTPPIINRQSITSQINHINRF